MTVTSAVSPEYSPLGDPVTAIFTGKVAVVELEAEATIPTDLARPNTFVVLPLGVIWACRPFFTEARSALPTVALTVQLLVEITTIPAVELELLELVPPADAPELPEPPVLLPPAPLDAFPVELPTESPVAMVTAATVPLIGEVMLAEVSACLAETSWAVAEAT